MKLKIKIKSKAKYFYYYTETLPVHKPVEQAEKLPFRLFGRKLAFQQ